VRSHAITGWDPEDRTDWEAGRHAIARRKLVWSVVAEHVGFSVWSLWSVMVLFMPHSVYGLTAGDKFLIAATATLVGSALRLPYTMATARFGGRNWTAFSACVLVAPITARAVAVRSSKRQVIAGHTGEPVSRITTRSRARRTPRSRAGSLLRVRDCWGRHCGAAARGSAPPEARRCCHRCRPFRRLRRGHRR
jgi:hypothetical protein